MNKTTIGFIFILVGALYGSLISDTVSNSTLGWLVKNQWIKQPPAGEVKEAQIFGPKSTILFYSLILIIIGMFILWNS